MIFVIFKKHIFIYLHFYIIQRISCDDTNFFLKRKPIFFHFKLLSKSFLLKIFMYIKSMCDLRSSIYYTGTNLHLS